MQKTRIRLMRDWRGRWGQTTGRWTNWKWSWGTGRESRTDWGESWRASTKRVSRSWVRWRRSTCSYCVRLDIEYLLDITKFKNGPLLPTQIRLQPIPCSLPCHHEPPGVDSSGSDHGRVVQGFLQERVGDLHIERLAHVLLLRRYVTHKHNNKCRTAANSGCKGENAGMVDSSSICIYKAVSLCVECGCI